MAYTTNYQTWYPLLIRARLQLQEYNQEVKPAIRSSESQAAGLCFLESSFPQQEQYAANPISYTTKGLPKHDQKRTFCCQSAIHPKTDQTATNRGKRTRSCKPSPGTPEGPAGMLREHSPERRELEPRRSRPADAPVPPPHLNRKARLHGGRNARKKGSNLSLSGIPFCPVFSSAKSSQNFSVTLNLTIYAQNIKYN